MDLYYVKHKGKERLFLCIGTKRDKLYLLDSPKVPHNEAEILKAAKLTLMDMETKLLWLKANCPVAYTNAFRIIDRKDIAISKIMPIA